MTKKPRQQLKVIDRPRKTNRFLREIKPDEFHSCDAPGCPNVISIADKPYYSGPIYCVLHRGRMVND